MCVLPAARQHRRSVFAVCFDEWGDSCVRLSLSSCRPCLVRHCRASSRDDCAVRNPTDKAGMLSGSAVPRGKAVKVSTLRTFPADLSGVKKSMSISRLR